MKKYCWIILMILSQTGFSQQKADAKDVGKEIKKDGQCFAKCLINTYQIKEQTYPVFTGEKKKRGVRLKTKNIILKQPISKWVKKKASPNCKSPDPNDCYVVCYEEIVPGETVQFQYVKNTSKTTEFENQTFNIYDKIASNYEVVQKVCNANIDEPLLSTVDKKLMAAGYYASNSTKNELDRISSTLSIFQRDNSLPIGQFDFQTLEKLNVKPNLYLK